MRGMCLCYGKVRGMDRRMLSYDHLRILLKKMNILEMT